jgi:hypothetical protein
LSKYRTAIPTGKNAQAAAPAVGPLQAWMRFWFTPADPVGLHALRVLSGLLFIFWLLPLAGHIDGLYSLQGWFDQQAYFDAAQMPDGPPQPTNWSILFVAGSNATLLNVMYWTALAVLLLFTLGLCTRVTAVLSWIIVVSFTANPVTLYDADSLLVLLAFYLMIGYLLLGQWGGGQSWVTRILGTDTWLFRKSREAEPQGSVAANVAVRLVQVNFAIVMVVSGLHKLQFGEWWSGAAFWYPLHPPFKTTFEHARDGISNPFVYLTFLSLGAYATLAWQVAFPTFAWRPRWRWLLLGGAFVGWLGLAFMYALPLFGPAICICCLGYLTPEEWQWLRDRLAQVPGLARLQSQPALPASEALKPNLKKEETSFLASRQR